MISLLGTSTLLNIHLGLSQSQCNLKSIPTENPKTIENTGVLAHENLIGHFKLGNGRTKNRGILLPLLVRYIAENVT